MVAAFPADNHPVDASPRCGCSKPASDVDRAEKWLARDESKACRERDEVRRSKVRPLLGLHRRADPHVLRPFAAPGDHLGDTLRALRQQKPIQHWRRSDHSPKPRAMFVEIWPALKDIGN